jgi:transcriptional regulator with XRE-family HTH domain
MGRNIEDIIKALPAERRSRVKTGAQQMALEMMQHAQSLDELRKAAGKTQAEVALKLGINQNAVSQLESRTELYLSTLNKYVGALGHRLELALVTATGERVELPHFHPWELAEAVASAAPGTSSKGLNSSRTKVPARAPVKPKPSQDSTTAPRRVG